MKMHGKKIDRPNREIIAIPRADGEDLIFIATAVLNYDEFNKMCPMPQPGVKLMKGGEKQFDFSSPSYMADLQRYSEKKYAWTIIQSIRETPGLEWETVDYGDPQTWGNYVKELTNSGFSDIECQRILRGVSDANCLNEGKVEEARKRFLAGIGQEQSAKSSFHLPELHSTPSGDVVRVGDSSPQESMPTVGKS